MVEVVALVAVEVSAAEVVVVVVDTEVEGVDTVEVEVAGAMAAAVEEEAMEATVVDTEEATGMVAEVEDSSRHAAEEASDVEVEGTTSRSYCHLFSHTALAIPLDICVYSMDLLLFQSRLLQLDRKSRGGCRWGQVGRSY